MCMHLGLHCPPTLRSSASYILPWLPFMLPTGWLNILQVHLRSGVQRTKLAKIFLLASSTF